MDERVVNGSIAGSVAFLLLIILGIFAPDIADKLPTGVEAAITVIISTFFAWLKPRTEGKAPS